MEHVSKRSFPGGDLGSPLPNAGREVGCEGEAEAQRRRSSCRWCSVTPAHCL